jgi:hypothetical protein
MISDYGIVVKVGLSARVLGPVYAYMLYMQDEILLTLLFKVNKIRAYL